MTQLNMESQSTPRIYPCEKNTLAEWRRNERQYAKRDAERIQYEAFMLKLNAGKAKLRESMALGK
jgi:ribosomal protein S30